MSGTFIYGYNDSAVSPRAGTQHGEAPESGTECDRIALLKQADTKTVNPCDPRYGSALFQSDAWGVQANAGHGELRLSMGSLSPEMARYYHQHTSQWDRKPITLRPLQAGVRTRDPPPSSTTTEAFARNDLSGWESDSSVDTLVGSPELRPKSLLLSPSPQRAQARAPVAPITAHAGRDTRSEGAICVRCGARTVVSRRCTRCGSRGGD